MFEWVKYVLCLTNRNYKILNTIKISCLPLTIFPISQIIIYRNNDHYVCRCVILREDFVFNNKKEVEKYLELETKILLKLFVWYLKKKSLFVPLKVIFTFVINRLATSQDCIINFCKWWCVDFRNMFVFYVFRKNQIFSRWICFQ